MAKYQLNVSRGTLFATLLLSGVVLLLLPTDLTKAFNFSFKSVLSFIQPSGKSDKSSDPNTLHSGQDSPLFVDAQFRTKYYNAVADLNKLQKDYLQLAGLRKDLKLAGPAMVLADVDHVQISAIEQELVIEPQVTNVLETGLYVIGNHTLIGSVTDVYKSKARVRLITDTKHTLPAGIWRDGSDSYIPCQLKGNGDGTCRVVNLSKKEHDVRRGDVVFAMPRKGYLNTGVIIGDVDNVFINVRNPLLWDIIVKPICDPESLETVAVIVMNPELIRED